MTEAQPPWTCPFCPLLCDRFAVERTPSGALALVGSDCACARAALAGFDAVPQAAGARIGGRASTLDAAIDEAARLLAQSRQPLFGGLGTDVAGARALYTLACRTGAICDPARGAPLAEGLRALQDRGGFTTTLAELRTRADLVVCFGGRPDERHPEFFRRAAMAPDDPRVLVVADRGDPFGAAAQLAMLVEGRSVAGVDSALQAAAQRLLAARYAVLVYEPGRLPGHGALIVETLQRVVATLNRSTRAAAFPLGGGDGAASVNQVFAWLSGLPLRSRLGPYGLEHEPVRFDAARLLDDGAVDLLLWIACFGPALAPPAAQLPRIVLGHPALEADDAEVFIPLATPGVGSDGHLFRADGVVMLPLHALRPDPLPTAAEVLQRIDAALQPEPSA
jgi:formylmethanofuran dehydrogenase subunit B